MKKIEMWNTAMLLEEIFDLPISSVNEIENNEIFKIKYERIVALLKAFDLYEEKEITKYDAKGKAIRVKQCDIEYVSQGKFILKRDRNIISEILQDIINISEKHYFFDKKHPFDKEEYFILKNFFMDMFEYRKELQSLINYYNRYLEADKGICLSAAITWKLSRKNLVSQAHEIDKIMGKIMGEEKIVSETELIEKYGFPNITKEELWDMMIDNL
jgi:hypothetical protein